MSDGASRIEVKIFGSDYVIAGDANPEHILSITNFVDSQMKELARAFPNLSVQKLAVLAAVNIADELFQLKANKTAEVNPQI
ncbi:MAG: cell division protein ZapA, partial [Leptospira sp.]|nr:cell division protein ZapA [Leptospira sp.]